MDQLNSIHTFICVVEEGSLSAAARRLSVSTSSIARQIGALEADLGVRLLHRNTRQQSLTDAGSQYYDRMKILLADLSDAKMATRSAHESVEGVLRVSLRISPAATVIIPALPKLFEGHPGLKLDIELTDERKDLIANNIDVAVWMGELPDSSLIARRLSPSSRSVAASPAYLQRHGAPKSPEDLKNHNCLVYSQYGNVWYFERDGETIPVEVSGSVVTENGLVLLSSAIHGVGLFVGHEWTLKSSVMAGTLCKVLEDYAVSPTPSPAPLYVVFPSSRHLSNRVRVFVQFLVSLFNERIPE